MWKFIALEFYVGGRFGSYNYDEVVTTKHLNQLEKHTITNTKFHHAFDTGLTLLLQPKFGNLKYSVRPYVGLGPSFHYIRGIHYIDNLYYGRTKYIDDGFAVGLKVKAGVRGQIAKHLLLGFNMEYLYYNTNFASEIDVSKYSNFSIGAEIGMIF